MFLSITAVILITILVGLLGVFWILSRRRPRHKTKTVSKASSPPPQSNGAVTRSSGDHVPPGHPKVDPIHQFADGEKDGVPFTCPFMAAFKEAKKKESAKEEEEVPEGNAVLEQFSDMMAGYEEFKRNKEMAAAKAEDDDPDMSEPTLVGHIKRLEQEKLILQLTEEEMKEEENARRSQLAEIFALMEAQKDKFGITSVTEMQKQMRLYVS